MTTIDWSATQNRIIQQAFWRIGVVPYGEQPDSEQQDIALFELNALMKFLAAKNLPKWNQTEYTFNTVASTRSYAVTNANAIGIGRAWYTDADSQIQPLDVYSKEEYENLTDRLVTEGTPSAVYFDRSLTTPTLYLYPIPDAVFAMTVQLDRKMTDWESSSGNSAFEIVPQHWIEPVTWKLSANLSHVFRLPLPERDRIEAKAENLMREALLDNFKSNDNGEVVFTYA